MTLVNSKFIEKYQIMLEKEPGSRVFAPLAEAYRKLGLYKEAKKICERGVKLNPEFASGRVAFAQLLMDQEDFSEAQKQLAKAIQLAPENILANSLFANLMLRLKKPKEALKAYKMVLFLNPNHLKAKNAVAKLESLTADEYDDDVFAMEKLTNQSLKPKDIELETITERQNPNQKLFLERHLSIIDAFLARNDVNKAKLCIERATKEIGMIPEVQKRYEMLKRIREGFKSNPVKSATNQAEPEATEKPKKKLKIKKLENLLKNININERV